MCELPDDINVTVQSVFQIPSNQMNENTLWALKEAIETELEQEEVDGVVVTHGTDTLEETAYFLDLTINDSRPVIITGSQRGPNVMGTDAFVNIKQSVLAAASEKTRDTGVIVVFNERIFTARYVKKIHASNIAGFYSDGYGYIGTVDQETVKVYQKPAEREYFPISSPVERVDIIPSYLGSDGVFIEASRKKGAKGIVLEGSGRGHISPLAMEEIEKAVEEGIMVLITTRAHEGDVRHVYDFPGSVFDLTNRGVLSGSDYDSKKARIKLAVLLRAGYSKEEIQNHFA